MSSNKRKGLLTSLKAIAISYLIVIVVVLLVVRFTSFKNWAEFGEALILPKVWLSLLGVLIFYLGLQTVVKISPSRKIAKELRAMPEPVGRICWYLGIVILVILVVVPVDPILQLSLTGLGLAIFGIGTGFISLSIANSSDDRMIAMANLKFYETMAVAQLYIQNLSQPNSDEWNRAYADRIHYDLKGATELEEWVKDPTLISEFNNTIQSLLDKTLEGQKHEHLARRLYEVKNRGQK